MYKIQGLWLPYHRHHKEWCGPVMRQQDARGYDWGATRSDSPGQNDQPFHRTRREDRAGMI